MIFCTLLESLQNTFILFVLSILFGILLDYVMPKLDNSKHILELLVECYFHMLLIILLVYFIDYIILLIPIIRCNNSKKRDMKYMAIIFAVIFYTTQNKLFNKLDYIVKTMIKI